MKLFLALLSVNAVAVLAAPSDNDAVVIEAAGCNTKPLSPFTCQKQSEFKHANCINLRETIAGETCHNCCCEDAATLGKLLA